MRGLTLTLLFLLIAAPAAVADFRLEPYKDELFRYPKIMGTMYGGDLVMIEFLKERDQAGRDEIELKKVREEYVSLDVNETKKTLTVGDGTNQVKFVGVGKTGGGAKIITLYLHGLHGDETLAQEDWRFGGNFNRLKNLMHRNGGVYLTPDFANFGGRGTEQVKTLIRHYTERSPGAPVIVGCASTGCKIAFRLLEDPQLAGDLGGIVFHGAPNPEVFFPMETLTELSRPVPLYIGHGSEDETNDWVTQELFFKKVRETVPGYPIRYELFVGGVHGTPIRMMDWRQVINWMLDVRDG